MSILLEQVSLRDCEVSEVFKTHLDKALGSLVWTECWLDFEEEVERTESKMQLW